MPSPSVKLLPSLERLQEVFDLDGGVLRWRKRPNPQARRISLGQVAGTPHGGRGYLSVRLDGQYLKVHRIVFKLHHGREPDPLLDHINNNKTDNRPENLHECSARENTAKDHPKRKLFTGASKTPAGRWRAVATHGRKQVFYGTYGTVKEASCAYAVGVWLHDHGIEPDLELVKAAVASAAICDSEHLIEQLSA